MARREEGDFQCEIFEQISKLSYQAQMWKADLIDHCHFEQCVMSFCLSPFPHGFPVYLSCATAACDCSGAHWSPLWLVVIMEIIWNGVEDCESEEIGRDESNAFLLLVTVSHVVDVTTCRDAA